MTSPAGPPIPRPAATLVVVRDAERGIEVLLMHRTKAMDFAGGAHVVGNRRGCCEARALAFAQHVFLSHYGVGSRRNRRAGQDPRHLARRERAIRRAARRDLERHG